MSDEKDKFISGASILHGEEKAEKLKIQFELNFTQTKINTSCDDSN